MNNGLTNPLGWAAAVARAVAMMLMATTLVLAGCTSPSSRVPYAQPGFNTPPDSIFGENPDYRLGPSDLVTITVYRAPEVSGDYRVDASGNIMLPLAGQTQVQGMTVAEVATHLRQVLGSRYFVNPDVTVTLKEATSQRITVDGSVNAPGVYPLTGRTTLMQAVAMARGANQEANLSRVVVFRQIEGQRMAAAFDLQAIRAAEMEDPLVYGSDIIIVDGSQTRQTLRDILMTIPIIGLFRPFF